MKRQPMMYASAFVLVLILLFALGFRIEHPQSGLSNSLGSAKSGLVVIKPANEITLGDKILVSSTTESSPILGMVSGIEGKFLDVHSQSGFVRVSQDAVMGKMVIVIPYFGVPLGLLGF